MLVGVALGNIYIIGLKVRKFLATNITKRALGGESISDELGHYSRGRSGQVGITFGISAHFKQIIVVEIIEIQMVDRAT